MGLPKKMITKAIDSAKFDEKQATMALDRLVSLGASNGPHATAAVPTTATATSKKRKKVINARALCHVTPRHITPHHATPRHVTSLHTTPRHAKPSHATLPAHP